MSNSEIKFIFDVDGTLTPSRQVIDSDFAIFFTKFCENNDVYLVTGSDYGKTEEQLGKTIMNAVKVCYNCSGNDVWIQGVNVRTGTWTISKELRKFLNSWLQSSRFPIRTANHIEQRPGCANFSVVGRNCSIKERAEYILWDKSKRERETICYQINTTFSGITATIGGETGIDIYPTGCDKGQIAYEFNSFDKLYFFGDKTQPGGNDYALAQLLSFPSVTFAVTDWEHTYKILKTL